MDAFSEVLNGVRLKGAMFFRAEFSAPWPLSTPHCRALAPTLAPGAPHMLIYHFLVDGSARVSLEGESDVELSPGDRSRSASTSRDTRAEPSTTK